MAHFLNIPSSIFNTRCLQERHENYTLEPLLKVGRWVENFLTQIGIRVKCNLVKLNPNLPKPVGSNQFNENISEIHNLISK